MQSLYKEKPHYELLDGLRGVAALTVIWYHFFEGFATSPVDQMLNHGYLAVDFFFVLSGFVIGYAYDDRWKNGLTKGNFLLRRLIRLQPMVFVAVVFGVIAFILQGREHLDHSVAPLWATIVCFLLALFMIPVWPGTEIDVRGNGEMFPLLGPAWSLFFEYIGSVLYAIWLHSLSVKSLRYVVAACGIGLIVAVIINISDGYSLGVGWSIANGGFFGGLMRLGFSFGIGLLMSRNFKPMKIKGAFWWCSLLMVGLMCVPYITTDGHISILNGLYDLVCTLIIFPIIVWMGASGNTTDQGSTIVCNFLGEISYPIYIIHYPAMYLFYAWVWNNNLTFSDVWWVTLVIFFILPIVSYLILRFYDKPVRKYLSNRFLKNKGIA